MIFNIQKLFFREIICFKINNKWNWINFENVLCQPGCISELIIRERNNICWNVSEID
jgi:hypothetical protein